MNSLFFCPQKILQAAPLLQKFKKMHHPSKIPHTLRRTVSKETQSFATFRLIQLTKFRFFLNSFHWKNSSIISRFPESSCWWDGVKSLPYRSLFTTIIVQPSSGKTNCSTIRLTVNWYWHTMHARISSHHQLASRATLGRGSHWHLVCGWLLLIKALSLWRQTAASVPVEGDMWERWGLSRLKLKPMFWKRQCLLFSCPCFGQLLRFFRLLHPTLKKEQPCIW